MRHVNVRIGEYIVISPIIKKQVNPKNSSIGNSPIGEHLPSCNPSTSFDDFSILAVRTKHFIRTDRKHVSNERSTIFD